MFTRRRRRRPRRPPLLVVLTVCACPCLGALCVRWVLGTANCRRGHNARPLLGRLSAAPTGAGNSARLQLETGSTIVQVACG